MKNSAYKKRSKKKLFKPGWFFIGRGMALHFFRGDLSVSACGIETGLKHIHSGHGTQQCKRCLKSMKENGRIKR